MIDIEKTNIVKVFISSNCDSNEDKQKGNIKYSIMRKSLKLLLESTEVCDVYIFEKGTATSYDVKSSYQNRLDDSDLAIVIVDNKDGIREGTQIEINRIKTLGKKCFYFFCNEQEKHPTELENQLRNSTSNPRYFTVTEFSEIPEEVYKSVVNDILAIYTSYCRGRLEVVGQKNIQTTEIKDETELTVASDSSISKNYVSSFVYTKALITKEVGMKSEEISQIIDIDKRCAELLGYVIGSQLTTFPSFDLISQDIKQLHKGNMQKLVAIRYEAVKAYFSGDLSNCIKKLEEAVEFIKSCKNIPHWLLNDVAIDLRHAQLSINQERCIMDLCLHGQDILDEDKEPLYYPVVDRIVSKYNEEIIKSFLDHSTQSPYTVDLGVASYTIEETANAFIVAYYYGSLTQMLMTCKRLYTYTIGLSLKVRNHRMFMFTVRLLLLSCDEKMLRRFLSIYGENTNNINSNDIESLLYSIQNQPIRYRRILAREYAFGFFGYYYPNEIFKQESVELLDDVKGSIKNGYTSGILIKPLFDAIIKTLHRFPEKEALSFILYIFEKQYTRYYDDAFMFLQNFRFAKLTKKAQKRYQDFLVKSLENEGLRNARGFYQAIQTMRQCETITHKPLDKAVKKYNEVFYESTYFLNVEKLGHDQGWKYTERFIEEIMQNNETQGKGGVYTGYASDPYLTISNIILKDDLMFTSGQLKRIIYALSGTIFAKAQTVEAKLRALELLCVIQSKQPYNRQIPKLYKEILEKREEILSAKELFLVKGYSKSNINMCICLLGLKLKQGEENEIGVRLVEIQNGDISEQITALCFLERLYCFDLTKLSSYAYNALFQFLLTESYNSNADVRYHAISVMAKISKAKYREIVLDRFVNIMDDEDYRGKVGLLYRLNREDIRIPKVKYIFDKGKVDNHYWVRVAANRFD